MRKRCGWSLKNGIAVVDVIIQKTIAFRGPIEISADRIAEEVSTVPLPEIELIFEALSHEEQVNRGYLLPKDVDKLTFGSRPLLRRPGRRHLLMDISWCASAFIVAITDAVESVGFKQLDDKIGMAAEKFVKTALASRGALAGTGHYVTHGEQGQCDAIVETDEHIFFLEVKKKNLRPYAKGGNLATLLNDLAPSLLESQVQIGQHEIRLRRYGELKLSDSGIDYVLKLGGREVERISVSLIEFGSLQDRNLLFQFFEAILQADFESKTSLGRFPSMQKKLRAQQAELTKLGSTYTSFRFFNSWFLSIPQLLVLLDGVKTAQDFQSELWRVRHVETGSGDFYCELARRGEAQKS